MNKIFTLHSGSWESHHLVGVFSSKEKAEAYVKFFNLKDNVSIEEETLDPLMPIIESGSAPFLVTCKKGKDDYIKAVLHNEHFHENNVHFTYGTMYYFVVAANEEAARLKGKIMRERLINEDWNSNANLGIQII